MLRAVDRVREPPVLMAADYCLVGPVRGMEAEYGLHHGSHLFVAVVVGALAQSLLVPVLWLQSMPKDKGRRRKKKRRPRGEEPREEPREEEPELQALDAVDEPRKAMVITEDAIASYLRYPGPLPKYIEVDVQVWDSSSCPTWFSAVSRTSWAVSTVL